MASSQGEPLTLDRVERGRTVALLAFGDALEPAFRDQLLSYGLQPGQLVEVLQQVPMTVVLCDHVEVALEAAVARRIKVGAAAPGGR